MKYTMLKNVRVAIDEMGTKTAWLFKGEEYSEKSDPPLRPEIGKALDEAGFAVRSKELGTPPPAEVELETALDAPTVTAAICGEVKRNGEVCHERKPCRYHDRKARTD